MSERANNVCRVSEVCRAILWIQTLSLARDWIKNLDRKETAPEDPWNDSADCIRAVIEAKLIARKDCAVTNSSVELHVVFADCQEGIRLDSPWFEVGKGRRWAREGAVGTGRTNTFRSRRRRRRASYGEGDAGTEKTWRGIGGCLLGVGGGGCSSGGCGGSGSGNRDDRRYDMSGSARQTSSAMLTTATRLAIPVGIVGVAIVMLVTEANRRYYAKE